MAATPAAQDPGTEPARMAAALVAHGPQAGPALRAVGAPPPAEARNTWVREWDAVADPLRGETLPVVLEVYGWLSWATSKYERNLLLDAMLLRRDRGNREEPPGRWVARKDHEKVLRAVILACLLDREGGWPAFPEGWAGLCVTDAKANVWLPPALRATLINWRYRPRSPPTPQLQSTQKRRRT